MIIVARYAVPTWDLCVVEDEGIVTCWNATNLSI